VAALRDIRRYQKSVELLIPRELFIGLVRELMEDIQGPGGVIKHIKRDALDALQEAAECTIVAEFESKYLFVFIPNTNLYTNRLLVTNLCAIHAKRVTIQQKDMALVRRLRKEMTGYAYPGRNEYEHQD
jgi:histone H3/H4